MTYFPFSWFSFVSSQRGYSRPAPLEPCVNLITWYLKNFGPVRHGISFTKKRNEFGAARVSGLLFPGGPPAVVRRIWAAIVNSVQAGSRWTRPHIGHEPIKIVPLQANKNTAATIPSIAAIGRIVAPLPHCLPRIVKWVAVHSVFGGRFFHCLSSQTAARSRASVHQTVTHNNFLSATITSTQPAPASAWLNGHYSPKPFASKMSFNLHFHKKYKLMAQLASLAT